MATDGPTPLPCDPEIFEKGSTVCVLDARSNAAERWVKAIAAKARARVDWHYSSGRANVLHLGDAESRQRVFEAINDLQDQLQGTILQVGGPGLYRAGVTEVPEGTIAVDPDFGPIIRK
mgnify:CR=1 FL=1